MKKRNLTTLTVIALLLVLLTLIAVSGTYAKYTTSVTGTAQAVVAKWAFSASTDDTNPLVENFEIDLGETATSGYVEANGIKKIYPGATGTITINVDNTDSEVGATLDVDATAKAGSVFTKGQFTFEKPAVTGEGVTGDDTNGYVIPAGKTATATVTWTWEYDESEDADAEDTDVGEAADGEATTLIDLVVTGIQVDPNETP